MAYAAYRDHEVRQPMARPRLRPACGFQVLSVTVNCVDAWRLRQAVAKCAGAGVVRCEVLVHERDAGADSGALRARLLIRLVSGGYLQVLHTWMRAVPSGELGDLVSWREHLRRCDLG